MWVRIIKILWVLYFLGILLVIGGIYAISHNWMNLVGEYPNPKEIENPKTDIASELWSADTVLLGKYYRENRSPIRYEELSVQLINTLIASEDIRFYAHSGIDFIGLMSIPYYLIVKRQERGASTITQQLAKNLFKTRKQLSGKLNSEPGTLKKVIDKFKEWVLAVRLEKAYTKKEIMTMYFNTVDFGSLAFGIKSAAKTYFNKTPKEILYHEAAILIGMLQAPSYYNPIRNPENAKSVRNEVLGKLARYKYISKLKADSLKALPVVDKDFYEVESHLTGLATYFRMEVQKELLKICEQLGVDLYADGLKIYTTLNSRMQKYAEDAVEKHMREQQRLFFEHWKGRNPWIDENGKEIPKFLERFAMPRTERYRELKKQFGDDSIAIQKVLNTPIKMEVFTWDEKKWKKRKDGIVVKYTMDTVLSPMDSLRYYKHFLNAGMMSMNPHTGHINAWVGGINNKFFQYDHVKQTYRQPGSTFKAFVYCVAIDELKMDPCTKVLDVPITFNVIEADEKGNPVTKSWTPKNTGPYTNQSYTLRQALGLSINSVAAYLVREVTPERVVKYTEEKFGIRYLREKYNVSARLDPVPALCLGTSDMSIFELVAAYGTFVNKGVWIEPNFITRIEDKNGKILWTDVPKTIEALKEEYAYIMTYMLRGTNEEPGSTAGRIRRYKFAQGAEVGGKTGTTSNYSDAWFVGFTKDLVAGIWVGGDDRAIHFRTLELGQGGRQAMPAIADFMEKVYADPALRYTKGVFPKPKVPLPFELDCSKYSTFIPDSLRRTNPEFDDGTQ
ncbi:MAG: transglycosylase domain-containing protein [Flammeovirgaceae bacterium]|nr:transglycosylase domain-containing protein [Flammeovirgaceae bacterium]MDW8286479.1 transglycosylase domain-containing protein [Flammeovirgaceae bacterium]